MHVLLHCVCKGEGGGSLAMYEGMSVRHWLKDLVSIHNNLLLLPVPNEYRQHCVCVSENDMLTCSRLLELKHVSVQGPTR